MLAFVTKVDPVLYGSMDTGILVPGFPHF